MPFALILTIILALLSVFQIALACGAPWGRLAWGGQHAVLPVRLRIGSALSLLIYAFIVLVAYDRLEAIDVFPPGFSAVTMWVVFGYFALGVLMNAISRSKSERNVMTPVTLVLTVLSLPIALGIGSLATAA